MDPLRPDLMDMTVDQRRGFPRSLGILGALFLVAAGTCWALAVYVRPLVPQWADSLLFGVLVLLGIVAASLAGVVAWLLTWAPRMLTRQGVVADADGLLLFQDAKWWFSGRRLHVPWSTLTGVRDHRPAGLGGRSGLVLQLHDLAPGARAPGWVMVVPAGGMPPEGQVQSDQARLFLTLHASGGDELARLIDRWRPGIGPGDEMADPGSRTAPTRVHKDFSEAPGASGAAGFPGELDASGTPSSPGSVRTGKTGAPRTPFGTAYSPGAGGTSERGTWLPVRGRRIVAWCVFPVVLIGTPLIMLVSFVLGSDAGRDSTAVLVLTTVVALGALVSAVLLPWYWAPQGVSGNEHGLAVRRESMWWAGSGGIFVPWADVRGLVTHNRTWEGAEETWGLPVVEVVVDHLDSGVRLPRWARTVPAGAQGWGTVVDLPRLGVTVSEPYLARRIELLVQRARPDLVAGAAPPSVNGSAPSPAVAGGSAADPSAVRSSDAPLEGRADRVAVRSPDFRADQWIAVPRRGLEWAFTAMGVLAAVAVLAVLGLRDNLWFPALSAVPVAATAAHAAIALACAAALVWTVAVPLPRRFARSGVRLTEDGMELIREDLWWSGGTRVVLPWARVRDVRGSRRPAMPTFSNAHPARGAVDVFVDAERAPDGLPHWARARTRATRATRAWTRRDGRPGPVRVRLVIGDQGRRRLLAAARPGASDRP
ncbi:hypothetical protein ACFXKD_09865 [Nocardiopsis aegyptia]|uniref:hypothetical protein n=1 Tax=Nocardiopsis aegyptia TaxID=220378 RepID=UPI003670C5C6